MIKRRVYEGPMGRVHGLIEEEIFANLPVTAGIEQKGLSGGKNWPGLMAHFTHALPPLDLKSSDYFLDVGCGLGEHAIIAALGFPKHYNIPSVRHALAVSSYEDEVSRAENLARFASKNQDIFRELVDWEFPGMLNLYAAAPHFKKETLGETPDNLHFLKTDIYHLPLPDDTADKTLSSSVASYIKGHNNRRSMLKELLRVTRPGGLINISSYAYEGMDGELTTGPHELLEIAGQLGVRLRQRPELFRDREAKLLDDRKKLAEEEHPLREIVFEIIEKTQPLPAGVMPQKT
ncbi:MAG: class I SAM-dependent methyltransferase [Methanobacteriota archaeon]